MPRKPTLLCAACDKPMHKSAASLPQGQAKCRECRGYGSGPSCGTKQRYNLGCRCDTCKAFVVEQARQTRAAYKAKHGVSYRTLFTSKPEQYGDRHRKRDAARRARKVGATVESFTHAEVFERDEWMCGICSEAVDQALTYPHPMSSSLDHIVPLSLDGEHSRANTRLAHLICNVRRGARVDDELSA